MDELKIIEDCLKGSRSGQKDLYALYYGKMMGVCLRYASNNSEAKDILHQGFLNVFDNMQKRDETISLESWVKKTIIDSALEYTRKNKQSLLIVSTVHANKRDANLKDEVADDSVPLALHKDEILKAIQKLTSGYRSVYNLFVIDGYSHQEIAEMLNFSEGTSKSNLNKAKFALRKNLFPLVNRING